MSLITGYQRCQCTFQIVVTGYTIPEDCHFILKAPTPVIKTFGNGIALDDDTATITLTADDLDLSPDEIKWEFFVIDDSGNRLPPLAEGDFKLNDTLSAELVDPEV
jgi:hypothetical protein